MTAVDGRKELEEHTDGKRAASLQPEDVLGCLILSSERRHLVELEMTAAHGLSREDYGAGFGNNSAVKLLEETCLCYYDEAPIWFRKRKAVFCRTHQGLSSRSPSCPGGRGPPLAFLSSSRLPPAQTDTAVFRGTPGCGFSVCLSLFNVIKTGVDLGEDWA